MKINKLLLFCAMSLTAVSAFSQHFISLYHEANRANQSVISDHYLLIGEKIDNLNDREITGFILETINKWGRGITNIFNNWHEGIQGLKVWFDPGYRNTPFMKYIQKLRIDLDNLSKYALILKDSLAKNRDANGNFDGCIVIEPEYHEACKVERIINETINTLKKIENRLQAHERYSNELKMYSKCIYVGSQK